MSSDHEGAHLPANQHGREMIFNQVAVSNSTGEGIDLSDGYPKLSEPPSLRDLLCEEIARLRRDGADVPYGILSLREAIADDLFASQGIRVDPARNITITGSASEALTAAVLAAAARNSLVIFFSPHFPIYATAATIAGATPCCVPISLDGVPDIAAFQSLLAGNNVSAVVLNTPHNPTGALLSGADCSRLVELCRDKRVMLISDEVFAHLAPPSAHISPMAVADADAQVVVIADSGKKFDLCGLRLGYVTAGETLTRRIRIIQQTMTYRIPVPLQATVAAGLRWARDGYYDELRSRILANAEILASALRAGLPPRAWVNVPAAGCFMIATTPGHTGFQLAARIANEANVLTLPGSAFSEGRPSGPDDQFVRISLARDFSQVQEAAARLRAMGLRAADDRPPRVQARLQPPRTRPEA